MAEKDKAYFRALASEFTDGSVDLIRQVLIKHDAGILEELYNQVSDFKKQLAGKDSVISSAVEIIETLTYESDDVKTKTFFKAKGFLEENAPPPPPPNVVFSDSGRKHKGK